MDDPWGSSSSTTAQPWSTSPPPPSPPPPPPSLPPPSTLFDDHLPTPRATDSDTEPDPWRHAREPQPSLREDEVGHWSSPTTTTTRDGIQQGTLVDGNEMGLHAVGIPSSMSTRSDGNTGGMVFDKSGSGWSDEDVDANAWASKSQDAEAEAEAEADEDEDGDEDDQVMSTINRSDHAQDKQDDILTPRRRHHDSERGQRDTYHLHREQDDDEDNEGDGRETTLQVGISWNGVEDESQGLERSLSPSPSPSPSPSVPVSVPQPPVPSTPPSPPLRRLPLETDVEFGSTSTNPFSTTFRSSPSPGPNPTLPRLDRSPPFSSSHVDAGVDADADAGFGGFGGFAHGLDRAIGIDHVAGLGVGVGVGVGGWETDEGAGWAVDSTGKPGDGADADDEVLDAWGGGLGDHDQDDESAQHRVGPSGSMGVVTAERRGDDWESARKAAERRELRAPAALVGRLEKAWPSLVMQAFELVEESGRRGAEEGGDEVPQLDKGMVERRDRLAAELTSRPSTLDHFVPLRSTQTYARCSEATLKAPMNATNSLLVQASRRGLGGAGGRSIGQLEREWGVRSRLGEPEVVPQQGGPPGGEGKARGWSIWGRKTTTTTAAGGGGGGNGATTPPTALTTSGGGLLEVKAMSPEHTGTSSIGARSSSSAVVFPSTSMNNVTTTTTASGSRPASPALSVSSSRVAPPPRTSGEHPHDEDAPPSAVGRFLGRFRRNRAPSPSVDLSNQDMQLTSDDFSFLAEVPSMSPTTTKSEPGVGDLLGGNEEINSLEHMLNSSVTPLPEPLAPPPMGHRASSRGGQTASGAPRASTQSREIDLFVDLDFSGSTTPVAEEPKQVQEGGSNGGLWSSMIPQSAGPSRNDPPPPLSSRLGTAPTSVVRPHAEAAATSVAVDNDDDGFGDFGVFNAGQPAKQSASDLPDTAFDDFGEFFTSSLKAAPAAPSTAPILSPQPQPATNPHFGNLDAAFGHANAKSATEQFVAAASAKSARWPAPPSPVPPVLAPPPRATARAGGSFDLFSSEPDNAAAKIGVPGASMLLPPPPPSSRGSQKSASPAHPLPPGRAAFVGTPPPTGTTPAQTKGGLSAQDLSFFDGL